MEEGNYRSINKSPAFYAPLVQAILEDDWNDAKAFIEKNQCCLGAAITKDQDTALIIAAATKRTRFVKEFVKLMTKNELELKSANECTALYFGAQTKIVTIAKVLVNKNNDLPMIFPKDSIQCLPLYAAIQTGNREMVSYLYSKTRIQDLDSENRIKLLKIAIFSDLYDTALKILDTLETEPAKENIKLWLPLELLARKPSEIGNKRQPSLWKRCINSCFGGRLCNKAMMQASAHQLVDRLWKKLIEGINFSSTLDDHMDLVYEAAKVGNVEFLLILVRSYYDLLWQLDNKNGSLFHVAIKHRQERVFNLIYEIGVTKDNLATYYVDGHNNMLHLAADFPSLDRLSIISGAALQMQRELLWFQEIENMVPKSYVNERNEKEEEEERETPREMFVRTHKELQKNGEKWMRNTANSCMLMAALIVTVVFPAAFTIPGGNDQVTGLPIFLKSNWFTVFFVSDAIAMFFSSTSILFFLSILTSRYTEKDFVNSLPLRLALGLASLFISIIGMLIAFSAACFSVFEKKKSTFLTDIIVVAPAVPISLFAILHQDLWSDTLNSAFYSRSFLFRSRNRLSKQRPLIMRLFEGIIMKIKGPRLQSVLIN